MSGAATKGKWTLTPEAWDVLMRRLADDPESSAHLYEELRRKLTMVFRASGCRYPEDLADRTLDRVAHLLEEKEIEDVFRYALTVARFIRSEHFRERGEQQLDEHIEVADTYVSNEEEEIRTDVRLRCLERCSRNLDDSDREVVVLWYAHQGRAKIELKQQLAEKLGVSAVALRVRAFRLRKEIRKCVDGCVRGNAV